MYFGPGNMLKSAQKPAGNSPAGRLGVIEASRSRGFLPQSGILAAKPAARRALPWRADLA
jgi:hypothetical protein